MQGTVAPMASIRFFFHTGSYRPAAIACYSVLKFCLNWPSGSGKEVENFDSLQTTADKLTKCDQESTFS